MRKLLDRQEVDRQISEMWTKIDHITDEDNGRHEAVEQALKKQESLYKQLDTQDKSIGVLWEAVNVINPDNPLQAALNIAANAERLKSVLKSYSLQKA